MVLLTRKAPVASGSPAVTADAVTAVRAYRAVWRGTESPMVVEMSSSAVAD